MRSCLTIWKPLFGAAAELYHINFFVIDRFICYRFRDAWRRGLVGQKASALQYHWPCDKLAPEILGWPRELIRIPHLGVSERNLPFKVYNLSFILDSREPVVDNANVDSTTLV